MCKVIGLGNVIINRCIDEKVSLDASKLQKLLYFMQKEFLVEYDEPFFIQDIVAAKCGPSIPDIARSFMTHDFGSNAKQHVKIAVLDKEKPIIDKIFKLYHHYSSLELMDISKKEKAWEIVWQSGVGEGSLITPATIIGACKC